jgi:anti-anti-sigma regulatory factor
VLDLEAVSFVDSQGAAKLAEIAELTRADGITMRLARVKTVVRQVLERERVIELVGADHVHGNIPGAVEAQLEVDRELVV